MNKNLAQKTFLDEKGNLFIQGDWYDSCLPRNVALDEMSYPDTAYSFATFFSEKPAGFSLGFASGNYGHGIFTAGKNGQITIGKFVVLQSTRIVCNLSVTIKDHCMFSWGSVITDSWIDSNNSSVQTRRNELELAGKNKNRHMEPTHAKPVLVEENVWVGFDAVIMPGVTIGRGAVIGCKSVVFTDVPPYAVMAGNPARIIKFLSPTDSGDVKKNALERFLKQ